MERPDLGRIKITRFFDMVRYLDLYFKTPEGVKPVECKWVFVRNLEMRK